MGKQATKDLELKDEHIRLTDDGRVVIDDPEIYEAVRQAHSGPTDEEGVSFNWKCKVGT